MKSMYQRLAAAALILLLAFGAAGMLSLKSWFRVHPATFQTSFVVVRDVEGPMNMRVRVKDSVWCSATAVGSRTFLTASHCLESFEPVTFASVRAEGYDIEKVLHDGDDNVLIVLKERSKPIFEHYVSPNQCNIGFGDQVFYWGNPGEFEDVLRIGPVVGVTSTPGHKFKGRLIDTKTWFGDSGAGLFSMDGCLYGTVSELGRFEAQSAYRDSHPAFARVFPLIFTAEQLKEVK